MLKPDGILVVMSKLWKELKSFKTWRYAHDPTHVVFYHEQTFRFIAIHFGFNILEMKKKQGSDFAKEMTHYLCKQPAHKRISGLIFSRSKAMGLWHLTHRPKSLSFTTCEIF